MPSLQEKLGPSPEPLSDSERLAVAGRQMMDKVLKPKVSDADLLSAKLHQLNPDRADYFLNKILAIDPNATDEQKTEQVMELLKQHSIGSHFHSEDTGDIVKGLMGPKGDPILQSVRLDFLAKAIERHDFGKLAMRDSTLNHPHDKFNADEENQKKAHPLLGSLILKILRFKDDLSARVALTHHLKYETAQDGHLEIVGYSKGDFLNYCIDNGLRPELTQEDQIAAFSDVYSALTDPSRPSNLYGTNDPEIPADERRKRAFELMDSKFFNDDYYQRGLGAPLFKAFKGADLDSKRKTPSSN